MMHQSADKSGVQFDIDFDANLAIDWEMKLGMLVAGVTSLQIRGSFSVAFAPLLRDFPVVGGMQIFCVNDPEIKLELTGVLDVVHSHVIRGGEKTKPGGKKTSPTDTLCGIHNSNMKQCAFLWSTVGGDRRLDDPP